jgi:tRNA(Met) C34 N-acetyltransferase TmcA
MVGNKLGTCLRGLGERRKVHLGTKRQRREKKKEKGKKNKNRQPSLQWRSPTPFKQRTASAKVSEVHYESQRDYLGKT